MCVLSLKSKFRVSVAFSGFISKFLQSVLYLFFSPDWKMSYWPKMTSVIFVSCLIPYHIILTDSWSSICTVTANCSGLWSYFCQPNIACGLLNFFLFQSLGRRTASSRPIAASCRQAAATGASCAWRLCETRAILSSTWRWTTCRASPATPARYAARSLSRGASSPRTSPNSAAAHSTRQQKSPYVRIRVVANFQTAGNKISVL